MTEDADTGLRSVIGREPDGSFEDESGLVKHWTAFGQVGLYAAFGRITQNTASPAFNHMSELLDLRKPQLTNVVWDVSAMQGFSAEAGPMPLRWFLSNRRFVRRFVLFMPERPLIRMVAHSAFAVAGASKHTYSNRDDFLTAVSDTLRRAEAATKT